MAQMKTALKYMKYKFSTQYSTEHERQQNPETSMTHTEEN